MSYESNIALGGALAGLTSGMDRHERRVRELRRDQREDARDQRDAEYHTERMKDSEINRQVRTQQLEVGKMNIDEAKIAQEHQAFVREADDAIRDIIMSDNTDRAAELYRKHFGGDMKVTRNQDGTFKLDVDGQSSPPLTRDHLIGLIHQAKDPNTYVQSMREREKAATERADKRAEEDYKHGHDLQLARVKAGLKTGAQEPKYMAADDGTLVALRGGRATPVAMGGLTATFRGEAAGSKKSSFTKDVDEIAQRLPRQPGESDEQHWLRAAEKRATLVGKNDPAAAIREFQKSLTIKLMDTTTASDPESLAQMQQTIKTLVEKFAQKYGAGAASEEDPLGIR